MHDEATNFVEFCVELDNEDDRLKSPGNPELRAQINAQLWDPKPVYDSRQAIAGDYVKFTQAGSPQPGTGGTQADDDLGYWWKLFTKLEARAKKAGIEPTQATIEHNPDLNGFGPWQNAWLLYQGRGNNAGRYAIAIRGTVFSNAPSAVEDVFFQSVKARAFLSNAVSFADSNASSIHSGFAHATFTAILDRRYGILQVLKDRQIPNGSVLYIVGHSQGAAMATLVHAFLHYAMRNAELGPNDPLGLNGKRYDLKSYGFAQPKPGNYSFAAEFARASQVLDNAIVINNDYDPVPKVPLTLESTQDLATDFHGQFVVARLVRMSALLGVILRGAIARIAEPFVRENAASYGNFFHFEAIKPIGGEQTDSSWNFTPAGRVIMVFGEPNPNQEADIFFQHHATTYRRLIGAQLGMSADAGVQRTSSGDGSA